MSKTTSFGILLIDDEADIRDALASHLSRVGHHAEIAADGASAIRALESRRFDIVMTDISMPDISGLDLLLKIKEHDSEIDVIMMTGFLDITLAVEAMRRGATDFFTKPFEFAAIDLRVQQVAERRQLREDAEAYRLLKREQELQVEAARSLARAAEERDRCNEGHSRRMASYGARIAERLCFSPEKIEQLRLACLLHDIGKIGISDGILNKPGRLTDDEYEQMKRHAEIGEYILKPISLLSPIAPIVRSHHERFDGAGYPDGLAGDDIPFHARIVCLVDHFDAITSKRPYRDPMTLKEALANIRSESGRIFDPVLVDVFVEMMEESQAEAVSF